MRHVSFELKISEKNITKRHDLNSLKKSGLEFIQSILDPSTQLPVMVCKVLDEDKFLVFANENSIRFKEVEI